jgi:hypothetical protein
MVWYVFDDTTSSETPAEQPARVIRSTALFSLALTIDIWPAIKVNMLSHIETILHSLEQPEGFRNCTVIYRIRIETKDFTYRE